MASFCVVDEQPFWLSVVPNPFLATLIGVVESVRCLSNAVVVKKLARSHQLACESPAPA